MADLYVGGPGTGVWAGAYTSVQAALIVAVGGDIIHVANNFTQTQSTSLTLTSAGTASNPVVIVSENPSTGEYSPGGKIITTSSGNMTLAGSYDIYGISLEVGTGAVNSGLILTNTPQDFQRFNSCSLSVVATGTSAEITGGVSANSATRVLIFKDCAVSVASATSSSTGSIVITTAVFEMHGGSFSAPLAANLVGPNAGLGRATIAGFYGVDLSSCSSSITLVDSDSDATSQVEFIDCKLPSGWTGDLVSPTLQPAESAIMWNTDSSGTNFRMRKRQFAGRTFSNSGVYRDTGATSDGTTRWSWRVEAETNAKRNGVHVETPWMMLWNDTSGTSKTVTVEIASDSTKTDAEVYMELRYLGASGSPLGTTISTRVASPLTTPTNLTTSSEAWTGSGTTVKQKMAVSFTPQLKGLVQVRVCTTTNIFVDPELTIV